MGHREEHCEQRGDRDDLAKLSTLNSLHDRSDQPSEAGANTMVWCRTRKENLARKTATSLLSASPQRSSSSSAQYDILCPGQT